MMWVTLALAGPLVDGAALRQAGQLERAEQVFQDLAQTDPSVTAWTELAVTRSWSGNLPGALQAYASALELDPTDVGAQVGRARVLGWSGRRRLADLTLAALPGEEAALTRASVQTARLRLGAARTTLSTLDPSPERDRLANQIDETRTRRFRLTTAVTSTSGSRVEGSLSQRVSGTLTLNGAAGWGATLSNPLVGGGFGTLGATWSDAGWWVTAAARVDGEGAWAVADVARAIGPCAPSVGLSVQPRTGALQGRVGGRCASERLAVDVRGFVRSGSQAVVVDVSTVGTWTAHARVVGLVGPSGGLAMVGVTREGSSSLLGLDVVHGTGALQGTGVQLRVGLH